MARTRRRLSMPPALVTGLVVLSVWWFVSHSGHVPSIFLPSPDAVVRRLTKLLLHSPLARFTWVTVKEALLGCLLAGSVGLPLAWVLHHSHFLSRALMPYIAAAQAVPAIAIAPLLVLWIGYGTLPVVVLCAFMVFFPITITALLGLEGLDRDVLDAARLDGAHGWSLLIHMEIPMALPAILAGLRTGFTLSITGAIVGEMIMGGHGLGQVLTSQRDSVDTTGLFATIVLLAILATTIFGLLLMMEKRSATVNAMRGSRPT
ncbi:ABC transporter permease [Actinomyces vulturis]|uniref:ABC transporter permease n=1 Tax=Actinomyces vulturis TaxID=1857645 RepID=UPI000836E27F|nr:ABC transporter permease [Actinomyces vulturis]